MTSAGHIYIAHLCALHVPRLRSFERPLREGTLAPDRMMGHRGKRHHDLAVKIRRLKYLAVLARLGLQLGGGAGAAFRLGMLLHYIADGAIGVPGTDPKHASYEAAVERSLRRGSIVTPSQVGGCSDVLFPEAAAPRANIFGRYQIPDPSTAAGNALSVSLRVANAVFAPSVHASDMHLARRLDKSRRAQERMLPHILRFEAGAAWYVPWSGLFGILGAVFAALGLWIGRGLWFWPALKFSLPDLAHLGYYSCCAASVVMLVKVGPSFPGTDFMLWALCSGMVFLVWGFGITAGASLAWQARLFWLIVSALLGPLAPVAMSLIALTSRLAKRGLCGPRL